MAANSLATIRNAILTSIHGRRLGFNSNDWLAGTRGQVKAITVATSDTTGTNLPNYGIVEIQTSTNDTFVLDDPVAGGEVTLKCGSTSTGVITVNSNNATFRSSGSSTSGSLSITGNLGAITLYGESTAIWAMQSRVGTSAVVHIST